MDEANRAMADGGAAQLRQDAGPRVPGHLWAVGLGSLLWNGFGGFDYLMSQTRNAAYLAQFTAEQRAYFDAFPAWSVAFWALGVWGAVAGSVLLLARRRLAVAAFGVSLVGLAVSMVYQYALSDMPASLKSTGMTLFTLVLVGVAVGLFVYARAMAARGVLR